MSHSAPGTGARQSTDWLDLCSDILRLTALFTARSGRRFTSDLASRENRNYQFDFLRPSHSLFGYFNRLTEQYTKILMPSKETLARLERRSGGSDKDGEDRVVEGRREVLKDAKVRVAYETWELSKRQELEDKQEAERIAFAEIDWQDFVVVSTVEFTEADEAGLVELPPPMSLSEVENMTIAQKKMAAMIMEGREDEVAEDQRELERGEEAEMEMDDDEDDVVVPAAGAAAGSADALEKERQRVVEIRTADSSGPMKIRKDYVPKGGLICSYSAALPEANVIPAHSKAAKGEGPGVHDVRRSAGPRRGVCGPRQDRAARPQVEGGAAPERGQPLVREPLATRSA